MWRVHEKNYWLMINCYIANITLISAILWCLVCMMVTIYVALGLFRPRNFHIYDRFPPNSTEIFSAEFCTKIGTIYFLRFLWKASGDIEKRQRIANGVANGELCFNPFYWDKWQFQCRCIYLYNFHKTVKFRFKIQDFIHNLHSVNNTVLVEVTFTQCESNRTITEIGGKNSSVCMEMRGKKLYGKNTHRCAGIPHISAESCIFSCIFRSTGPIAVARRRSVGPSVRPSTPVTRQPIFGPFSKSVGIFLGWISLDLFSFL